MSEWFAMINGAKQGPFAEEVLKNMISTGVIPDSVPIWTEGMPGWQRAHAVACFGNDAVNGHTSSAQNHKPPSAFKVSIIVIGAFMLFGMIVLSFSGGGNTGDESSEIVVTEQQKNGTENNDPLIKQAENFNQEVDELNNDTWRYGTSEDKMGRGTAKHAYTESVNTIELEFPYQGPQHATLTVRTHPKYGKDIFVSVERGQFTCEQYDNCTVSVRFDNGSIRTYRYSGTTSAGDNSTIFINDYNTFLSAIKKSKRVKIEAAFFNNGKQVLDFNVDGLKW